MTVTASPIRVTRQAGARVPASRRTTPVLLRIAAVSIAVLALVAGLIAALATSERQGATTAAWQNAEPLMVTAQAVDTSLSDADTTAAASFLQGRLEPAGLQRRYQSDLAMRLGRRRRARPARPALIPTWRQVSRPFRRTCPVYAGIVQDADFNERQAFYPLAAAYISRSQQPHALVDPARLRPRSTGQRASTLGRRPIARGLPAAGDPCGPGLPRAAGRPRGGPALAQPPLPPHLERAAGDRHRDRPRPGRLVDSGARHARPGVNSALANGSRPVSTFTQARILALRARADDELTLLTRDSDPTYQSDYSSTAAAPPAPARRSGSRPARPAPPCATELARAKAAFGSYAPCTARSGTTMRAAIWAGAVGLASGTGAGQLPAISSDLNSDLVRRDHRPPSRPSSRATSGAASDLDGLIWGLAVGAILVAALVLIGFQPRIAEYR